MASLVKAVFLLLNVIVLLLGVCVMGVGLLAHYKYNYLINGMSQTTTFLPYFTIGTGVFVTSVSFIGCCGVRSKNTWLLKLYMTYLSAVLLFEVGSLSTGIKTILAMKEINLLEIYFIKLILTSCLLYHTIFFVILA